MLKISHIDSLTKSTYNYFKTQSKIRGEQTALIDEMIGNQKIVQAFSYEDESLERFDEINERLTKASVRAATGGWYKRMFSGFVVPCQNLMSSLPCFSQTVVQLIIRTGKPMWV